MFLSLLKGKLMSPLLMCSFQLTPEASIPHFSGPSTRGPGQHFPNTTCLGLAPSTFRPCFLSLHVFQSHGSCLGSFHMIGMGDPRVSTWTREAENPRIHWPRTKQFFVPSEYINESQALKRIHCKWQKDEKTLLPRQQAQYNIICEDLIGAPM